ncbi:MAG: hypothetical protein C4522_02745 [Desulfobacteraceae bacterium]|nr:MAG: hypothetical protein C4522_02745 [Desulfobacteraceae bacterium]
MFVILEAVRNISLPFINSKEIVLMFDFQPGINQIDADVWDRVKKANAECFKAEYALILRPAEVDTDFKCKEHLFDYKENEMLKIISNTFTEKFLRFLLKMERSRSTGFEPRTTVLDAIMDRLPQAKSTLPEGFFEGEYIV